jgi:hypothetical protein
MKGNGKYDGSADGISGSACRDCGVSPGQLHVEGCDVEACPYCGHQVISCCCATQELIGVPDDDRMPWAGEWPGEAECRKFGWYARINRCGPGWVPSGPEEAGAIPDLNRLLAEARWDRGRKRWVRKRKSKRQAGREK